MKGDLLCNVKKCAYHDDTAALCPGYDPASPLNCHHGAKNPENCRTYQFHNKTCSDMVYRTDHYTQNSVVSKKEDRINELVEAHWKYIESVLTAGQDKNQTFTFKQVMEMRKFDYTSSAIHFYGHGFEDAIK